MRVYLLYWSFAGIHFSSPMSLPTAKEICPLKYGRLTSAVDWEASVSRVNFSVVIGTPMCMGVRQDSWLPGVYFVPVTWAFSSECLCPEIDVSMYHCIFFTVCVYTWTLGSQRGARGCWNVNLCPLGEQEALLTDAEHSLQPCASPSLPDTRVVS